MSVPRHEMARRLGIDATVSEDVSRRNFVKLLGASIALAGLDGCTRMPASNILPYVNQPELTPGVPQYYATSMVFEGYATGLLVESHDGLPSKIEGNPDHPASLGAAGVHEQASILQLYDPDRATRIRHGIGAATWEELAAALGPEGLRPRLGGGGRGLAVLLEPTSSPLERELIDRVRELYPAARVFFDAPLAPANDTFVLQYDVGAADVIVAADADFLAAGPFHLRYAREFGGRRRPGPGAMNRLYVMEPSPTPTGAAADHHFAMKPSEVAVALDRLLAAVTGTADAPESRDPISIVARDLLAHRGSSLVIPGARLPAAARASAQRINSALGNDGRTVWTTRSALMGAGDPGSSFAAFVDALQRGNIDTVICAGGNPSYASAGVLSVSASIRRVRQSVYLGLYENETARDCQWMVPGVHYLEAWGDARAYDGTLSIVQPLIEPIATRRSTSELLSLLLGAPDKRTYALLRESWQARRSNDPAGFEDYWRGVLRRGSVEGSAFPREVAPPPPAPSVRSDAAPAVEILFRPHPRVHDGRFANNGWLQELPDPVTTLTWQNAAQMSPATAQRHAVVTGDVVDLQAGGRTLRIPALVLPGHADDAVTVHFGYGRDGAERVARGAGADVYPLWPGDRFAIEGATLAKAAGAPARQLAVTQSHHSLESSDAARVMTLTQYQHARPEHAPHATLYEPPRSLPDPAAPQQWGMTVDLGACSGCGACVVACQAENNVPVVGQGQVLRGREMHWLRIDWYAAAPGHAALMRQPMLCQHCEKAPCEYVCPVEATVHSSDGLNEMIYNRCVGTRFCSNNCPYKVRRFNWFDFNADLGDTAQLVKNPDVTVRERGVMEKCTFCVQRIRQAEIAARVDRRPLRGSDVKTACQQTCPTQAITFGSIADAGDPVNRARDSRRTYAVLDDLATEPRVRYLAAVRNPNPDLERGS